HYTVMLPGTLLVPLWCWQQHQTERAKRLTVTGCALVLAHYFALQIAGRIGVLGIGTTIWYTYATYCVGWEATADQQAEFALPDGQSLENEREQPKAMHSSQPLRHAA